MRSIVIEPTAAILEAWPALLVDPAVYMEGSDWKHLEWQFTLAAPGASSAPYQWISVGGATAVAKVVSIDDEGAVTDTVLDEAGTVTLTDTGYAKLDVDATLRDAMPAGKYIRRYLFTMADGSVEKSPPIYFEIQRDI